MRFNKLVILYLLGAILLSAHLTGAQNEVPSGDNIEESIRQNNNDGGILGTLLTPIRVTIDQALKFFGRRLDNVNEGVDLMKLQTYKMFLRVYNKSYSPEELPRRMALFFLRKKEIDESVKDYQEGRALFAMKENAFADWDDSEIKKLTGVSLPEPNELEPEEIVNSNKRKIVSRSFLVDGDDDFNEIDLDDDTGLSVAQASIPATKDWRSSGCISPPINQMKCGACYAIATMSVVESMRCIAQVSSPILSPQQIVDCATARVGYENYGCDGGWPTRVLRYLQDVGVAARERCYPFVRRQNSCQLRQVKAKDGCTVSASPSGNRLNYKVLTNERDIMYHVATTGPVVTVMKATDKFLYYGTGIFDDNSCSRSRNDVDHAIVIVGYGKQNGVDYWIIKNSWGQTSWGQGGYGLYRRGRNACSIGHWGWVVSK